MQETDSKTIQLYKESYRSQFGYDTPLTDAQIFSRILASPEWSSLADEDPVFKQARRGATVDYQRDQGYAKTMGHGFMEDAGSNISLIGNLGALSLDIAGNTEAARKSYQWGKDLNEKYFGDYSVDYSMKDVIEGRGQGFDIWAAKTFGGLLPTVAGIVGASVVSGGAASWAPLAGKIAKKQTTNYITKRLARKFGKEFL